MFVWGAVLLFYIKKWYRLEIKLSYKYHLETLKLSDITLNLSDITLEASDTTLKFYVKSLNLLEIVNVPQVHGFIIY